MAQHGAVGSDPGENEWTALHTLRHVPAVLRGARTSLLPLLMSYGSWCQLSSDQRRFAEARDAFPGIRAGADRGSVFIYNERRSTTYRWLVDQRGRVLEFVVLRYTPRGKPRRFVRVAVEPGLRPWRPTLRVPRDSPRSRR